MKKIKAKKSTRSGIPEPANQRKASFKAYRVHSDKLSSYGHGRRDMSIDTRTDHRESIADTVLKQMVSGSMSRRGQNAARSKGY